MFYVLSLFGEMIQFDLRIFLTRSLLPRDLIEVVGLQSYVLYMCFLFQTTVRIVVQVGVLRDMVLIHGQIMENLDKRCAIFRLVLRS